MAFVSVFDLFKVGVGPSSSHTVGPMRAALDFVARLGPARNRVRKVRVTLFGSLAHTGLGHHTDRAIFWGLSGIEPESFTQAQAEAVLERLYREHRLDLSEPGAEDRVSTSFHPGEDLRFDREREIRVHPNEVLFEAFDADGSVLSSRTYFSVGGGFIATDDELASKVMASIEENVPHPFKSAEELLAMAARHEMSIADVMRANELTVRTDEELRAGLQKIWAVMQDCIERGLHTQGLLPGGLRVRRRAAELGETLKQQGHLARTSAMDWVHVWAMAVNEENAAGGQVVTAPTNGAAGIVPAVLMYYHRHTSEPNRAPQRATEEFLLTATAVGMLFKRNASISGAEVGCQGEVGAAASMAAAGLTAVWGGTNAQIENAAEMAIEHSLGLTCDPIGGLVQVPCIERNGFGAAKAISAARLAMLGDGSHRVSLDRAIETMRQTGFDMSAKYKETAQGGLAVTYVEC